MSASLRAATNALRSCSSTSRASMSTFRAVYRTPSSLQRVPARWYSAEAETGTKDASSDASGSTPPAEGSKPLEGDVEAKLKAKDEEIADLTSRLRYQQADFVNLQKITAREKEQTSQYAITNFARDLLTTVDVLALALKSVPESAIKASEADSLNIPHLKQLYEGVDMTQRQLLQTLNKYGVKPYDPTGEKFDPNVHEALYEAPIPGKEPGTVIETSKVGYKIKERTLRAAQVGVAK